MKLEKAIEINEALKDAAIAAGHSDTGDSIALGIEALKRIDAWRNDNDEDLLWDLPGETP